VPDVLQEIPGIGPSMAQDLRDLGVFKISDLVGQDAESMYKRLCQIHDMHIDRCVLYVFRCAVYYASEKNHDPELLSWWNWKGVSLADKLSSSEHRRQPG
jgi:hypothetical protein